MSSGTELETSFLITDPELPERLLELDSLSGFELTPAEELHIRDTYFDLPDGALAHERVAFRLRNLDDHRLYLTVKGPSRPVPGGGVKRTEMELPYSETALRLVLEEISRHGVSLPAPVPVPGGTNVLERLRNLGFVITQTRACDRTLRRFFPAGQRAPVAELALDQVRYSFAPAGEEALPEVLHSELELESEDPAVLRQVSQALRDVAGAGLRRWEYGKIATGKAMERLLRTDGAAALERSRLTPAAYDRLELLLS